MAQPEWVVAIVREMKMDFIESWLGLSPDGGDGSLEALWVGALVLAVLVVAFRHRIAARFARRH
jgi:hypothetical protein